MNCIPVLIWYSVISTIQQTCLRSAFMNSPHLRLNQLVLVHFGIGYWNIVAMMLFHSYYVVSVWREKFVKWSIYLLQQCESMVLCQYRQSPSHIQTIVCFGGIRLIGCNSAKKETSHCQLITGTVIFHSRCFRLHLYLLLKLIQASIAKIILQEEAAWE